MSQKAVQVFLAYFTARERQMYHLATCLSSKDPEVLAVVEKLIKLLGVED